MIAVVLLMLLFCGIAAFDEADDCRREREAERLWAIAREDAVGLGFNHHGERE